VAEYGTKWPKAVAKITDDLDVLLEFDNYPAEHWVHLRTTDERFNSGVWRCRPAGTGLASWAGVVDPGAKSRVVGLGALPRSLPLEGLTVAPQWRRPRPSLSGCYRGLLAGRLGCQSATSWR